MSVILWNRGEPKDISRRKFYIRLIKFENSKILEAEYIALSTAMRDLLPGRALLKEIGAKLQLSFCKESVIMSKVWEDNTGL